ncbi:MAG TPA: nuclear transport factor 2 family protein [Candidatus Competibacteraceae bacterium]|nr:nuclear transport factor 2 family protein [Candidatus Competibacteraceae bacterium]
MNRETAECFVSEWLDAWNTHDLPRILAHYTDDFEMNSPVITNVMGIPEGQLTGKQAVGAYWAKALELFPNLRFEPICTMIGVNSIVIYYVGATGKRVAEVFSFNTAGLVYRAHAHYEQ